MITRPWQQTMRGDCNKTDLPNPSAQLLRLARGNLCRHVVGEMQGRNDIFAELQYDKCGDDNPQPKGSERSEWTVLGPQKPHARHTHLE